MEVWADKDFEKAIKRAGMTAEEILLEKSGKVGMGVMEVIPPGLELITGKLGKEDGKGRQK